MVNVVDILTRHGLEHASDAPWSNWTKADYTPEQWHSACLIHQHTGPPTSKDQCKLPVKTPDGAVNRNGVHAAAAALAGARGGINASSEEQDKAAHALVRLYHSLDEDPPASLLKHMDNDDILEHYGVKGMKWGVSRAERKAARQAPTEVVVTQKRPGTLVKGAGGTNLPAHTDAVTAATARQKAKASTIDALGNEELQALVKRMNLEQQYSTLSSQQTHRMTSGQRFLAKFRKNKDLQQKVGNIAGDYAQKRVGSALAKQAAKSVATAAVLAV